MRKSQTIAVTFTLLLGITGCDDGGGTADAGTDAGTTPMMDGGTDAGAPGTDSGPPDPCAATMSNAISSLGCNGGVYGSTPMDDEIGGPCTPDGMDPPGPSTCTPVSGTQAACVPDEADPTTGTCLYFCPPSGSYVSTGDCPTGSRCFTLDTDFALCFRDCNSAADCFDGEECDGEGSCVAGEAPPTDGGVTDGGATGDGGITLPDGAIVLPDGGVGG